MPPPLMRLLPELHWCLSMRFSLARSGARSLRCGAVLADDDHDTDEAEHADDVDTTEWRGW